MKLAVALAIAATLGLVASQASNAHLITKPKSETLKATLASQTKNLAHAKYVCNNGANKTKRWHCNATMWLSREARETHKVLHPPIPTGSPIAIICAVFGSQCNEAITVARCESGGTFSPYAQNGQYLGTFQMGDWARSTYGHGYTIYEQAVAAKRYYDDSGWSGWQCSPYGGLQW